MASLTGLVTTALFPGDDPRILGLQLFISVPAVMQRTQNNVASPGPADYLRYVPRELPTVAAAGWFLYLTEPLTLPGGDRTAAIQAATFFGLWYMGVEGDITLDDFSYRRAQGAFYKSVFVAQVARFALFSKDVGDAIGKTQRRVKGAPDELRRALA